MKVAFKKVSCINDPFVFEKNSIIVKTFLSIIIYLFFVLALPKTLNAKIISGFVTMSPGSDRFKLATSDTVAPLLLSSADYPGVMRVAQHLQIDIGNVSGVQPEIISDRIPNEKQIVIIGTIGKNPTIEQLINTKKLNVNGISGKWDTYIITIIESPLPGIERALVIAGSNKRGTIYGMYDLAAGIGVSPWYWWADVPVKKKSNIYIKPLEYSPGEPKVKYRGIFINDEAPALADWVNENYGGFNAKFYEKVFELILRMKGNFLWPAMWGRAFYDDDPKNPELADEYGIVSGTSHHEPMMRAHVEWQRYGAGPWAYDRNEQNLKEFWREGIERMDDYESIITLAMRGDGDEPMSEESNIALLEKIVRDQREIISEVTGKKLESLPQVWALYKEVQAYYDKGMRVPDDVTLLLCDDNWGNIRKLPNLEDEFRSGGYGIYYHFDYVGGPRNYKWLNTTQISRVWEQMHLAYEYGADRIWVVNVGDIKPMEFPINFFLDYAWDPEKWPAEKLPEYGVYWAEDQFGPEYSQEIADILTQYTRYNSRRKPELLAPETYSLIHYREAERVVDDYNQLANKANNIYDSLPAEYKDAFYQLVLHPVLACSNLNELYVTVGKNHLYAQQGRAATSEMAEKAKRLYARDGEITDYYHNELADGKWNHMMSQTHIGYTYWQQPDKNAMPEVKEIILSTEADMGIAIEGSDNWWPNHEIEAILPELDVFNKQKTYLEIFNRGKSAFKYFIKPGQSWIKTSQSEGEISTQERVWISIDWDDVPDGKHQVPISITGPSDYKVIVKAVVNKPIITESDLKNCFVESNGAISIEAEHFTQAVNGNPISWQKIPQLGRTLSAMTAFPVTAQAISPGADSPRLEYQVYLFSKGQIKVKTYLSPTLNFHNNQGLRYGVSIDNEKPEIVNMHKGKTFQDWEESVRNNTTVEVSVHKIIEPGKHVLKFWYIDPGVVLQKIVIETGEIPTSYLGPPESVYMQ
jgi:hypothetical protein